MAYVGYTGVANLANTTPGFADGVGARADIPSTFGEDVGGGGVVDLYQGTTPPPVTAYFILMENSGYVLQQDDVSKIQLQ
jgi:hypothetical protein